MTNMPVDYFGHYTFVEPFVDGYYKVGETEKARALYHQLKTKYQERLTYYAGTPKDQQYRNIEEIVNDMRAYRRNIDILIRNKDREVAEKETLIFNEYIENFQHFYGDEIIKESQEEEPRELKDSNRIDTIESISQ